MFTEIFFAARGTKKLCVHWIYNRNKNWWRKACKGPIWYEIGGTRPKVYDWSDVWHGFAVAFEKVLVSKNLFSSVLIDKQPAPVGQWKEHLTRQEKL